MTIKTMLGFLEPKNQNLPAVSVRTDVKGATVIFVPVVEDEEKEVKKAFPSIKEKFSGKKGETLSVIHNNQDYRFVGVGPAKSVNSRTMRRFYGTSFLSALGRKPKVIGLYCPLQWVEFATLAVDVAALDPGMFKPKYKKEKMPEVILTHPDFKTKKKQADTAVKNGRALAEGKNLMRILGALPPNELNTQVYAELITALAKKWGVACERVNRNKLKDYALLNAVSAGSKYPSELLVLTLHPKKGKSKHATALVGKGLCYDSGGLQSKQNYMKSMKEDMAGSAAVLGTVLALKKGGWEVRETTHFVLALAENMMGEAAMRADDVYTTGDGQTVEIIHTDAEGRLALADAICYTKAHFKNTRRYFTIATLTGSCIIALGEHYTGVVCNHGELAKEVEGVGRETGEHMHTGPWDMDYDDNNSPVADVANLGEVDREAGWIKAGMFLYRFVPKAKKEAEQAQFCHLDIAGSIDMGGKGKPWRRKGFSSGIGVSALTRLLRG